MNSQPIIWYYRIHEENPRLTLICLKLLKQIYENQRQVEIQSPIGIAILLEN